MRSWSRVTEPRTQPVWQATRSEGVENVDSNVYLASVFSCPSPIFYAEGVA